MVRYPEQKRPAGNYKTPRAVKLFPISLNAVKSNLTLHVIAYITPYDT